MSIWEWKCKETELLLICKLAELQTTSPLKEHSKIQGLGIHCEIVPYLEGSQEPWLARENQRDLKPRCLHRNREHSSQPPNGAGDPAQIMLHTPALEFSPVPCPLYLFARSGSWTITLGCWQPPATSFVISIQFIPCTCQNVTWISATSTKLTPVMSLLATRRWYRGQRSTEQSVVGTGSNDFEPDFYCL